MSVSEQSVALNNPVIFTASIPCSKGYVYHEDETGVFILRGIVNCQSSCFARYEVTFNGNIALPVAATVGPIAIAITQNGETIPASIAIVTPTVVDSYFNVTSTATITVPKGCCFTVSVRSVVADAAETPAPAINVQNATFRVKRTA